MVCCKRRRLCSIPEAQNMLRAFKDWPLLLRVPELAALAAHSAACLDHWCYCSHQMTRRLRTASHRSECSKCCSERCLCFQPRWQLRQSRILGLLLVRNNRLILRLHTRVLGGAVTIISYFSSQRLRPRTRFLLFVITNTAMRRGVLCSSVWSHQRIDYCSDLAAGA